MEQMMNTAMDTGAAGMSSASMGATKKEGKGAMMGMALCAVLAVAGVGFGIYGLSKQSSKNADLNTLSDKDFEAISVVSDLKEISTTQIAESQEIVVTNPYILRDLNHKMAILHGLKDGEIATESSKYLATAIAYNDIDALYGDEEFTASRKAAIVISSAIKNLGQWKYGYGSVSEAIQTAANEVRSSGYGVADITPDELYNHLGYISYSQANQLYQDTFGETLQKESFSGGCGRGYTYIAGADGFADSMVLAGVGGCGGAGFPGFAVRKGDYKAKGDEIYIDVNVIASALNDDMTGCNVYLGYVGYDETGHISTDKEVVDSFTDVPNACSFSDDYLTANSSLFDKADSYRFTFKKNSSGVYAFQKIEKL